MSGLLSRSELFSRGARGGAALLVTGSAFGALAEDAAAGTLPDADAAWVRLLIAAELLAIDFYTQATASGFFQKPMAGYLKRALADEQVHYDSLSQILASAGGTPLGAPDVNFSYPAGSFASGASIAKLGVGLERTVLGAYLGAVAVLETATVRLPLGQISANEAQHVSVWSGFASGRPIGRPFAAALTIEQATNALAVFES